MPLIAVNNDIELFYEASGDPNGPPVLLIAGLGVQLIDWPDYFIEPLVAAGFYVVRFDNRDIGLSTTFDDAPHDPQAVLAAVLAGEEAVVGYTLADMAADATGLLDALGIEAAHVVGVSMGAMIAQTAAILFPDRVLSLSSLMSTTGASDVGQPTPEAMKAILAAAPGTDRQVIIDHKLASAKVWASPDHFDAERLLDLFNASWDRVGGPQALNAGRQFCAIIAGSERDDELRRLSVPSLVVHGKADTLISVTGGERTAECIPNAKLVLVGGMGHDLPPAFAPDIAQEIIDLVAQGSAA